MVPAGARRHPGTCDDEDHDEPEDDEPDEESLFGRVFADLADLPETEDGRADVADLAAALFPASGTPGERSAGPG